MVATPQPLPERRGGRWLLMIRRMEASVEVSFGHGISHAAEKACALVPTILHARDVTDL